jgi:ABC-2 type transport system permease protein
VADAARLWLAYASASVRSQMQYRASFVASALGQFLSTGIEFVAVWALFDRFGALDAWSLAEVAVFYGVAHVSLALADLVSTGWDQSYKLIRMGHLDRLLLRPRTTVLQLLGYEFQLRRLGRLAQGATVLAWATASVGVGWTWGGALLLVGAVVGGACLFLGLFVLQGTMAIWTVESLEVVNATTYGGVQAAQYPLSIYERWFRRFFTYLVPLAAVVYFPVVAALGKPDPLGVPHWVGAVSWVVGPVFLAGAFGAWGVGVRHYTSTGS